MVAQTISAQIFGILIGSFDTAGEITNPVKTPVNTINPDRNLFSVSEITVKYYFP